MEILGYFQIWLGTERQARRLGTGQRQVVAYQGSSSRTVRVLEPATLKTVTFTPAEWDEVGRTASPGP